MRDSMMTTFTRAAAAFSFLAVAAAVTELTASGGGGGTPRRHRREGEMGLSGKKGSASILSLNDGPKAGAQENSTKKKAKARRGDENNDNAFGRPLEDDADDGNVFFDALDSRELQGGAGRFFMSMSMPVAMPTSMPVVATAPPTPSPSSEPSEEPSSEPSQDPTADPTPRPTERVPTPRPTPSPTLRPMPTRKPRRPLPSPTPRPTDEVAPTDAPTTAPPTASPTKEPGATPPPVESPSPTFDPTASPTLNPTVNPTANPTANPTPEPTEGCGGYQLVPEPEAVVFDVTPPGLYERITLPAGGILDLSGVDAIEVTPPFDEEDPWLYGTEFALERCVNEPSLFRVAFNEGGGYVLRMINEGTVTDTFTVLVDEDLEEKDGKSETGEYKEFDAHAGDIVITDDAPGSDDDRSGKKRRAYYGSKTGGNVKKVTSVADAVTKICDEADTGKIKKLVFANHGKPGQISAGDGNKRENGKWFGKNSAGNPIGSYNDLINGLKDKNKFADDAEICIIGCNVGNDTAGQKLAECVAKDLGVKVRAKKGSVKYRKRNGKWKAYAVGGDTWTEASPP